MFSIVHCFFEQSGCFRDEFRKLGYNAYDYDISNSFGRTDFVCDLFDELDAFGSGEAHILQMFDSSHLVFAFFPCTRFQCFYPLIFKGQTFGKHRISLEKQLSRCIRLHDELNAYYRRLCYLFQAAERYGFSLIVENPYTQPHYLTMFFPVQPSVIHYDRTLYGDWFKKPTQYLFCNFESQGNFVVEPFELKNPRNIMNVSNRLQRSLISPEYARHFILEHIVDFDCPQIIRRS